MPGEPAEKPGHETSHGHQDYGERALPPFLTQLGDGEGRHQQPHGESGATDADGPPGEGIGRQRRQPRQPGKQPRPQGGGGQCGQAEGQNDPPCGVSSDQRELEQVVQQVHDRRRGHGDLHREEQGEGQKEQRPQAEAGNERQARGEQGDGADDGVLQSRPRARAAASSSPIPRSTARARRSVKPRREKRPWFTSSSRQTSRWWAPCRWAAYIMPSRPE